MSLRTRIFIVASALIVVVLAVTLILWNNTRQKGGKGNTTTSTSVNDTSGFKVIDANNFTTVTTPVVDERSVPRRQNSPEEASNQAILQLAKIFVERYGTYSSDNNFQNIKEVRELVTNALWTVIKPGDSKKPAGFVGVTTQAIMGEFVKKNASDAIVKVKTIRIEQRDGKVSNFQQVGVVTLVKQGQVWLVDKIVWEK